MSNLPPIDRAALDDFEVRLNNGERPVSLEPLRRRWLANPGACRKSAAPRGFGTYARKGHREAFLDAADTDRLVAEKVRDDCPAGSGRLRAI